MASASSAALANLVLSHCDDRRAVAVEHPERQPQRPHILAAQRLLVAEAEGLHRIEGELRDVEPDHLPFGELVVVERVAVIAGLGEVARAELALVGDDQAAGLQIVDIGLQRRRVHRDQHVGRVARGLDRGRAEIDLEGGDAEGRALRRADLGREIREGGEIVAGQRGGQGELPAGQLHAVAAIAGEPDDHRFQRRVGFRFFGGQIMAGRGQSDFLGVRTRGRTLDPASARRQPLAGPFHSLMWRC